ncbi:MAG TPA: type III secretion system outer membrane ring subunit SctC, partial [Steroidobacteraceae bacterium]
TFSYVAQDKPLKEFIREFSAGEGVNVVVAAEVEGTVNGKFNLAPQSMLDLLAMSFGLTWYYDGSVLYVYLAGDLSTEVLPLGATTAGSLQQALNRLGISDRRFPISYDRAHNTARVAGPKRYVELVKQTVGALDQQTTEPASDSAAVRAVIRVFPLRYAWAADFTYTADGQDHTLPGLASVLQQLYSPTAAVSSVSARPGKLERMRGLGYFRDNQVAGDSAPVTAVAPTQEPAGPPNGYMAPLQPEGRLPQFQADGRMNAVIIRDLPERMGFYDSVIRSLDVKPGLIEIEARIIEVDVNSVDDLGIDWAGHSGSADLRVSSRTPISASSSSSTSVPAATYPVVPYRGFALPPIIPPTQLPLGGVLTTVLGDSGRYLKARINALAEEGKANILSSPRVLTLDNVEAVLENLSTFFVPVAGNLDVGLYNVSAGTSLRVTPLIVTEDGHTQIKLAVRIEDGGISQQSVGTLPVVQRTSITTQAFINEGESLLIGGYRSDARNVTEAGVPGLSSIPVVGNLFKHHQKETTHVEHLFMLTPRVVGTAVKP